MQPTQQNPPPTTAESLEKQRQHDAATAQGRTKGLEASAAQKPSPGRMVIFTESVTDAKGKVTALGDSPAVIQRVNIDGTVRLWVFGELQVFLKQNIHPGGANLDGVLGTDDLPTPGCWHWPARV